MASMKLKLTIHSAKDLNNVKYMGTMSPYAIISMANNGKFRTSTAMNGGLNPIWNESVEFNINQDECMKGNQVIIFDIYHGGIVFDRTIGQVQVPLKHLLLKHACGEKVNYPVTSASGGEEGSIIISYILSIVSEGSKVVDDDPHKPMASKKLKLVIHSANDLNNVKLMGTMNPYAMVSITGGTSRFRTSTVTNGGSNPVWNSFMEFSIDEDACTQVVMVEMFHNGTAFDRPIGQVQVSLEDLLLGHASGEKVGYPVMGEEVGTIDISYTISFVSESSKAVEDSNDSVNEPKDGVSIWTVLDSTLSVVTIAMEIMEYL
ncbi:hypothetical protein LXL04_030678 [Taraxacum kok-saghyz]